MSEPVVVTPNEDAGNVTPVGHGKGGWAARAGQSMKRMLSRKQVRDPDIPWDMPGAIVKAGGMKTHYQLSGTKTGRLVVLMHGMGTYCGVFDSLTLSLENAGFLVLRYDLLGMGFSGIAPVRQYNVKNLTLQLEWLLKDLGLTSKPYDIIGHSVGGALAVKYAYGHPKAQQLILLAPTGLCDPSGKASCFCLGGGGDTVVIGTEEASWKQGFHGQTGAALEAAKEFVAQQKAMYSHSPECKETMWHHERQFPKDDIQGDIENVMQRVGRRVMVLWGDKDTVVPYNPTFERWKGVTDHGHANVSYHTVEDAGHMAFLEKKEEVNGKIVDFLLTRPTRRESATGVKTTSTSSSPAGFTSMSGGGVLEFASLKVDSMGRPREAIEAIE